MKSKLSRRKAVLYIVISLLISIGIWVHVDNVRGYTVYSKTYELPIDFVGQNTTLADRGLMLLEDTESSLKLRFEGNRKLIAELDPSKVHIQVDLSDVTKTGKQHLSYKIVYPSNKFSKGISSVSASSYTVFVDIGELYSRKVDIHCDIQGKVADGYIAGNLRTTPEKLELRGQEDEVNQVSYVKVVLNIDNAEETVTQSLSYQFYDKNDKLIKDTKNIHPIVDQIQVVLPVNVVKELPLKMNFLEKPGASLSNLSYTITPSTITLSGPAEKLKKINSIVLGELDLSKISEATTFNYAITVPDGCENLSGVTRATLKVAFKDMMTTKITTKNIVCTNEPSDKKVSILTNELRVQLRGKTSDLKALTADDIKVTVDLSDISSASGSYTVPATITINTKGDVGVIGNYQIKITILDADDPEK